MDTERICPNCRKPLPPGVQLGLCPECGIKAGFPPICSPPGGQPATGPNAMIVAPAVGLMVVGALKLLGGLKILLIFGWPGVDRLNSLFPGLSGFSGWNALIVFDAAFKIVAGLLILFGGYCMFRRQSYAWAIAAGIISIVACSILGLPVGIWALVILAQRDVVSVFNANSLSAPASPSPRPKRFWAGFTALMAGVLLFLAVLAVMMIVAVRTMADSMGKPDLSSQSLQTADIYRQGQEFRKDFSQSFPLDTNGQFGIDNVNGRIDIHGWNSNFVVINAVIHGKTAASVAAVKINVNSDPSRASVHTILPSHVNDFSSFWDWLRKDTGNAKVDYTVRLPLHARLESVSTVNGTATIDGVVDDITVATVNGTARVTNAAGNLNLTTVNGTVTADMDKLGDKQSVVLNAVNGKIQLRVPDNADAKFSIATVNGSICSDFPDLAVKRVFPIGSSLNGTLRDGAASVSANTVNGTIKILKVAPGQIPVGPPVQKSASIR